MREKCLENTKKSAMSPSSRAYSYIRFSSKPQEQGDSLRRQLGLARAWAVRNPGYHLDESTYRDLGIPAFHGKNRTEGALWCVHQGN